MDFPSNYEPKERIFTARNIFLPIIIIFAGIIVASAIYIVRIRHQVANGSGAPEAVRPVTPDDHIIGNPGAPVVVVEYADIDSEYSKSFQLTMEQVMTEYASGNKVAWVYRHFPVSTLHADAAMNALAAECAASVTSPANFFRFVDAMQSAAPGAQSFNPLQYDAILDPLSVPKASFHDCVNKATFEKRIHDDYSNALASGATGSPYIVLLVQGQKPRQIQGALPYKAIKKILDDEIAKLPK